MAVAVASNRPSTIDNPPTIHDPPSSIHVPHESARSVHKRHTRARSDGWMDGDAIYHWHLRSLSTIAHRTRTRPSHWLRRLRNRKYHVQLRTATTYLEAGALNRDRPGVCAISHGHISRGHHLPHLPWPHPGSLQLKVSRSHIAHIRRPCPRSRPHLAPRTSLANGRIPNEKMILRPEGFEVQRSPYAAAACRVTHAG